jgi:hypothetical protein
MSNNSLNEPVVAYQDGLNEFSATMGTLNVTDLNATNATIDNLTATLCTLTNAMITNETVLNSLMTNCTLTNGLITNETVTNSRITNGTLTNAVITNATLSNINLTNALITNETISNLVMPNLIANQLLFADSNKALSNFTLAVNGAIPIGSNAGSGPVASTLGSGTSIVITNGQGSISIDTIQDIRSSAVPSFKGLLISTSGISSSGSIDAPWLRLTNTTNQLYCGAGNGSRTICDFIAPVGGSDVTLVFPNTSDTMVGKNTTDTLTNKTLTTPTITSLYGGGGLLSMPALADTLVTRTNTETLTNKTLITPTITIGTLGTPTILTTNFSNIVTGVSVPAYSLLAADISAQLSSYSLLDGQILMGVSGGAPVAGYPTAVAHQTVISHSGAPAINIGTVQDIDTTSNVTFASAKLTNNLFIGSGTKITNIIGSAVANATLTLPGITDTLVARTTTDTLTNKTLTTPTITSLYGGGGLLTMPSLADTLVAKSTTDTLTNKTLTTPTLLSFRGITGLLTAPTGTDVLVGRDTSDTLTNKVMTTPTLLSFRGITGLLTSPTGTDVLVGRATADTLTNKVLTTPTLLSFRGITGLLTSPTGTDVLVARATTDAMTNKTIAFTNGGTVLDYYFTATAGYTVTGGTSAGQITTQTLTGNCYFTRIGNVVTVTIQGNTGTSNSTNNQAVLALTYPTGCAPSSTFDFFIDVLVASANQEGLLDVQATQMIITASANFAGFGTGGGNRGWKQIAVTYTTGV